MAPLSQRRGPSAGGGIRAANFVRQLLFMDKHEERHFFSITAK